MTIQKILYFLMIFIGSCALLLFPAHQNSWGSVFPLDEETVFCIFHKMSGKKMVDQVLEELCITLGRPTFTPYKPAEMFLKNSLRKFREQLQEKARKYNDNSIFRRSHSGVIISRNNKVLGYKTDFRSIEMPRPTPFISAKISRNGLKSIYRTLDSLVRKKLDPGFSQKNKAPFDINIYFKPEKIAYGYHKRIIAGEDVLLPHSYVIFRPVRLEICDTGEPVKILTFRDFPEK